MAKKILSFVVGLIAGAGSLAAVAYVLFNLLVTTKTK